MVEWLKHIDEVVFFIINELHTPLLDQLMWLVSGGLIFLPLFILIGWQIYKLKKYRYFLTVLLSIIFIIVFCDQSSTLVKRAVQRYRPTHNLVIKERVHVVNDYRGGQFGFFSGHAANTFGVATFLFFVLSWWKRRYLLFLWPLIVIYSRIYLGVHYPSDVLFGMMDGIIIGSIMYRLFKFAVVKFNYEAA
ncbi:MAG: phosphatase PAP2 family protein [Bacteroidia bacterium]